jgi:hypothetical protein
LNEEITEIIDFRHGSTRSAEEKKKKKISGQLVLYVLGAILY